MGKIIYFLCFVISVYPSDANENRKHIHVVRRGSKKSHIGNTVAKIWIEENGLKKIDICWSELSADEESEIIRIIDLHYNHIVECIDKIFKGKKIDILRITK